MKSRVLGAACIGMLLFGGMAFAAGAPSIEAVLNDHQGKSVTLTLEGGKEISGKVGGISPVTVRIIELTGKEFYEAVVRLEDISAITVRSAGK